MKEHCATTVDKLGMEIVCNNNPSSTTNDLDDYACREFFIDTYSLPDDQSVTSEYSNCSDVLSVGNAVDTFVFDHHMVEVNVPTPKSVYKTPTSILAAENIGCCTSRQILRVLFDTGAMKTMIHRRVLPKDAKPVKTQTKQTFRTLAGKLTTTEMVVLRNIRLLEFNKNRKINEQKALVFDHPCRYDVIAGADFLDKIGIDFLYSTKEVKWFDDTIPFRNPLELDAIAYHAMVESYRIQEEDDEFGDDAFDQFIIDQFATVIKDAKYEKIDIDAVLDKSPHLDDNQKEDLANLLRKHSKLFDGSLGKYPHKKVHIELEEGAEPVHHRGYPVPRIHMETFKKELFHLVELGVLERQGGSAWSSPSFIVPKKDGRVRWITDLRELNKCVKRRKYPLPIINDVLRKRTGYSFFTKLDLSMQYYHFELDDESKDLTTIATPFGLFRYNRLPMGLKSSPDFAQEVMESVLHDIEETEVNIDDVS